MTEDITLAWVRPVERLDELLPSFLARIQQSQDDAEFDLRALQRRGSGEVTFAIIRHSGSATPEDAWRRNPSAYRFILAGSYRPWEIVDQFTVGREQTITLRFLQR